MRLTCNPSVAWFVHHYLSTNHDTPDCQVEAIVLRASTSISPEPWMAKAISLLIISLKQLIITTLYYLILHFFLLYITPSFFSYLHSLGQVGQLNPGSFKLLHPIRQVGQLNPGSFKPLHPLGQIGHLNFRPLILLIFLSKIA